MTIYGPACTCPPVDKPIPHNTGCPRYDDDRVWSIEDRAECRELAEASERRCQNCAPGYDCESGIYTPTNLAEAGPAIAPTQEQHP